MALVCTVLANIHRGKRRPFKIDDFMPQRRRQDAPLLPSSLLLGHLRAWAESFKRVKRKG